ncbi:hypothetical protein FNJ87_12200 [Nonlabens mediterrranea]|uniref:Curlin subunit CsgB n=1 Tax=Nonlabens mediterrranea TaxID=1419947 RepID=A0ABS0A6R6_9FLAO|nr:hypothetical protein BBFL7_02229 [Flavobacteria bacterium BBFL7]MBF4985063.1 hypothetical protein [Nonlabens mediterrranea]
MKKILFLLVFTTFTALGQTYVDDSQVINTANLQTTNAQLNLASDQNSSTSNTTTQFVNQNSVFIEQVGNSNSAIVSVASDDSQISLYQNGTLNSTTLNHSADRIRQNIVQIGNSNVIYDYSTMGAASHNLNIVQNGNYNTSISAGSNAISENMQINQTGNGRSVYVINF